MNKDASGKFVRGGRGGPGRGRKKELSDRFRRETIGECVQALSDAQPELETALAGVDADLAQAEQSYLEAIAPLLKRRAQAEVSVGRARVAMEYLRNPLAFNGFGATPSAEAMLEHQRIVGELKEAEQELVDNPDPGLSRMEAIGDHDVWTQLCDFERCRDRVFELRGLEIRARQTAEAHGNVIQPAGGEFFVADGVVRSLNFRREFLNS